MTLPRFVAETPAWAWLTLVGLAALAVIDRLRDAGLASGSLVLGTLPNLLAVPILTFGFLTVFYPHPRYAPMIARPFAIAFAAVVAIVIGWEVLQLAGNLVFDPMDLVATGLGALLTLALYPVAARDGRKPEEVRS